MIAIRRSARDESRTHRGPRKVPSHWGNSRRVGCTPPERTRRFRDAVTAGVLVGVATIAVFHFAAILRVNVFLEQIRHRNDWQGLLARFRASDFQSLQAYANYEYLKRTPLLLAIGVVAGAVSGVLAGAISGVSRTATLPSK
jgi:hypothetical protein